MKSISSIYLLQIEIWFLLNPSIDLHDLETELRNDLGESEAELADNVTNNDSSEL